METANSTTGREEDGRRFIEDPRALACPRFDSPFAERTLEGLDAPPEWIQYARDFARDGYLVLEDFVEPELVESVLGSYGWLFDRKTRFDAPPVIKEVLERDPTRKQDAWYVCEPVSELACHARVIELLEFLYGRTAIPFQTLNFVKGTEQSMHSDSMHFSSLPAGFMCGAWVALEEVNEENGPLLYVPKSHRFLDVQLDDLGLRAGERHALGGNYDVYESYLRALIAEHGMEPERLSVKKGSLLIWAANLLHGGAPILAPGSTRKSQVTHYYFEDCVYYTPAHSNRTLGEYYLREVWNARTRDFVEHNLNGQELRFMAVGEGRFRLYEPDAFERMQREAELEIEPEPRIYLDPPADTALNRLLMRVARFCDKRLARNPESWDMNLDQVFEPSQHPPRVQASDRERVHRIR